MLHVTAKCTNMYCLCATLLALRVPFEYKPHKKWGIRGYKSPWGFSVCEFDLLEDGEGEREHEAGISEILYNMNEKYGSTFGFEIVHQMKF